MSDPLLADEPGRTELLLGNEAIARGAIEAGVGFACGYPGTPSSEVTDTFARLAGPLGIPFEYSVNEKVALEMAFAACLAGVRAIVAMKHLGLMYAGDPLSTIPYVGTVAGLVIVSAGDPSLHTSPNEQDQRHLAEMLHVPMLDPRTPQEALEATRFAFDLSERSRLPVIVRPTTRVCHLSAPVRFGPLLPSVARGFERDPRRLLPMPSNARRMRTEINDRLDVARSMLERSRLCERSGRGRRGVLASGAPAAICADLLGEDGGLGRDGDELTLLATAVVHPLPEEWLVEMLGDLDTVLVVEELSAYLEDRVRALCALHGLATKIRGKRTGDLPTEHEYTPEIVASAMGDLVGRARPVGLDEPRRSLPTRPPTLCAACPHRSAFFAARSVFGDDVNYFNDIGCYTLGALPPLGAGDALLCMGAGFTLAAGVARTTGERTVGFLGDSTFFHSGMPALLNAIKEQVNMVAVIMDNEVTAMTGFQESPGIEIEGGRSRRSIDIAAVVTALGAPHVETVDPDDLASTVAAFERAKHRDELSVVITSRPCPVYLDRSGASASRSGEPLRQGVVAYTIDHDRCGRCGRAELGKRCDQGIAHEFERAMARARSLEVGGEVERPAVAPCAERCPLFLCIQGYAAHIAGGRYADALELIVSGLPLPDTVCRVCHRPCESACVRTDQPVAINDLKRFVMDWAQCQDDLPARSTAEPSNGMSVAVVGAGPAGLAAAHELAMRGYGVRLIDSADEPGGVLARGIPAYRLPREVLARDIRRILDLGVSFEGGRLLGSDLMLSELLEEHDAIVLAVGAGRAIRLDLGEPVGGGPDVVEGLDYLRTP
ncbi:MAG: thiamine pyrophosphate-dependent enzyme, partial [Acidimicrobiales bacterium]